MHPDQDDGIDTAVATWLESIRRLQGSRVSRMDRQLFVYVMGWLPAPSGLDALASLTHASLQQRWTPHAHRSPIMEMLDTAAALRRQMSHHESLTKPPSPPSLDTVLRQLELAQGALPRRHRQVLDLCLEGSMPPRCMAQRLAMTESLMHRYHTQARALLRCHPWR